MFSYIVLKLVAYHVSNRGCHKTKHDLSRLNLGREKKNTVPYQHQAAESHGISHGIYDVFNFWLTIPPFTLW